MKIQSLFTHLGSYNYIASLTGQKRKEIYFSLDGIWKEKFSLYSEFKKWLKENYVGDLVDEILLGTYTLNVPKSVGYYDCLGSLDSVEVLFEI